MEKKIGKIKYVVPQSYVSKQFAAGKDSFEIKNELRAVIRKCIQSIDMEDGINIYSSGEDVIRLKDTASFKKCPWDFIISDN